VFVVGHDGKEHDTANDEAQCDARRHRQHYTYTHQAIDVKNVQIKIKKR